MKVDSVRAFKAQVSDEVKASADFPAARSFFESTEAPMPAEMGLGIAKRSDGEHVLAIRTPNPEAAAAMAARVRGEADVRILSVSARPGLPYFQERRRPLESGQQIGMASRNFVGTLGAFARDADGRLGVLSNAHVIADSGRAEVGHPFGQPFGTNPADRIGTLTRFVLPSRQAPGVADAAFGRLDRTEALPRFSRALGGDIRGVRALTPEDLGRDVVKGGRTTDVRLGRITVVEVDGLGVSYDQGILTFNDQGEASGGPATDFSAAGDSGSLVLLSDGWAVGLLFAGGFDGTEDRTYFNPLPRVLAALGITLAI